MCALIVQNKQLLTLQNKILSHSVGTCLLLTFLCTSHEKRGH